MTMLAEIAEFVIGVDSHKEEHAAAVVNQVGGVLEEAQAMASDAGYRRLLRFAQEHADGVRVWAIEGTGSYGAGLFAFLDQQGEWVVEIDGIKREGRRHGKSDAIDAIRAARTALKTPVEKLVSPRQRGPRQALRLLLTSRNEVVKSRTRTLNQLHAALVAAPDELRTKLRSLTGKQLLLACSRLRQVPAHRQDPEWSAYVDVLRRTAKRALELTAEAQAYEQSILALVRQQAPQLLEKKGVGAVTAGQVLVSWSHQGRFRSDAAFAMVAGVAPLEASSGKHVRHRLNPGGDRQLNRALHTIVISRQRCDPATIDYTARRTKEGKSPREIRRCLKRYVARELFKALEHRAAPNEHLGIAA
jgi:transposase